MGALPGTERMPVEWGPRPEPLLPLAAAAIGRDALVLARRLLALDEERLSRLHGVAGKELLVVLGASEDLPWVPGVLYLGKDAEAPSLLLPTTLAPSVPSALLARALTHRFPAERPPLAILPKQQEVISLQAARPLDRSRLQAWLDTGDPTASKPAPEHLNT